MNKFHVHIQKNTYLSFFLQLHASRGNERAIFYDVLLGKCEKCGAGMENSHRSGTFPSMIWKFRQQDKSWKLHEKLKYQACNSACCTIRNDQLQISNAIETSFAASFAQLSQDMLLC